MFLLGITSGGGLVAFLIAVLVIIVIVFVLKLLLAELGVGGNIGKIIWIIVAALAIIYLFNRFGSAL